MDKQEIFNRVATHMAKQGCRSTRIDPDSSKKVCSYRGDDGTMCSTGCLIPDENYSEKMEGKHIIDTAVQRVLKEIGVLDKDDALESLCMLCYLQDIHDHTPVNEWERDFKELAEHYFLEMPVLDWSKCNSTKED